ncbi:MAG: hypothetical protein PF488_04780 [Patescibacteria group bacterium]|jgi:hypothetical protein|nr:hypothetical protein [Patescibacteria group bacterium]
MNEEEFEIAEKMEKFGDSFVKCLAVCFYHADRPNIDKLKNAFSEYWEQYKKIN